MFAQTGCTPDPAGTGGGGGGGGRIYFGTRRGDEIRLKVRVRVLVLRIYPTSSSIHWAACTGTLGTLGTSTRRSATACACNVRAQTRPEPGPALLAASRSGSCAPIAPPPSPRVRPEHPLSAIARPEQSLRPPTRRSRWSALPPQARPCLRPVADHSAVTGGPREEALSFRS
jgi:hypothetical protein